MGSLLSSPLSSDMGEADNLLFRKPPTGWPSADLVNDQTEFPVFLVETSANGTYPCHHELLVDFSQVYGLPPFHFEDRRGPDNEIPFCGAIFQLCANLEDRTTFFSARITPNGVDYLNPCKLYNVRQHNSSTSLGPTGGTPWLYPRHRQLCVSDETRRSV